MATPPGGGGDVPQAGYYPDPSIPGYIRYWNGGAWVPGTSRPAPQEGETPPAPPASGAPMPGPAAPMEPEPAAAPVTPATPAVPAVEETGPLFFDEDPEPSSAWQATTSGQTGFGGERDQKVSWGHPDAADPRMAPTAWPAAGGQAEPPAATPASAPLPAPAPTPEPARDHATTTLKAPGPRATPAAAPATPAWPAPGDHAEPAAAPAWPAAGAAPAAADSGHGAGTVPPQTARPASGAPQDRPAPAAPAPARQEAAPASAPAWPEGHQSAAPGPLAGGSVNSGPASSPWAQQSPPTPRTPQVSRTPGVAQPGLSAQPSPVPQAARPAPLPRPAQPAQAGGQQPVTPWKPPVEDPFLAAVREQAAARPAGLGRRLLARIVDGVVFGAALGAVAYPLGRAALDHIDEKIETARQSGVTVQVWLVDSTTAAQFGIILAAFLLLGVVYEALPTAKWGRTLGKKLCGIQVRDIEAHEPPTFGAALRRWLVYGVLGLLVIGVVNVLWCLFDRPWRQCWHDKAAGTFVAAG
ncbi:RDD family protein [Streptomyces laurentii]|uniref:RDD family protein n=1 Tax=Streptomyces laurentii TaxID=39478 RepID=UPI00368CE5DF